MTKKEQLQLFDNFAAKLRETLINKGEDYATEADVLSNFKTSSKMARITVLSVIIVEITKKVSRIVNLSKKGKIAANEPLEDSILDLCGYAFLLLCAVTEKKIVTPSVTHEVLFCGKEKVFEGSLADCDKFLQSKAEPGFLLEGHGAVTRLVNKGNEYFVNENYYELRKI